mmetsp:Transcript_6908/g.16860  ORF Transcript_6908/g.16860 Transcript_6908/m.16860 type:complete len:90 (-) Transcript_6908:59-328(-)
MVYYLSRRKDYCCFGLLSFESCSLLSDFHDNFLASRNSLDTFVVSETEDSTSQVEKNNYIILFFRFVLLRAAIERYNTTKQTTLEMIRI